MSRLRRGFSFFEVALVLFLVAVVGMIAVPGVLMRVRERDEARAVAILEEIALAQHERRHAGAGAYARLPELAAEGALAGVEFDGALDGDFVRIGGYYLAIFLPDAEGLPIPYAWSQDADPAASRRAFLAIAWPVRSGETGYRSYAVDQDLLLHDTRDRDPARSGAQLPDLSRVRLLRPAAARLVDPWRPLLPEVTAPRMRDRLEAAGLPVPPALASVLKAIRE